VRREENDVKIEVLGSGCAKCQRLYAEAERAVAEAGVAADLVKVEDMQAIVARGVMLTPALAVEGRIKSSGRIPPADEIVGWLREAGA
jgi:small redox-active disulfide protein 2